MIKRLIPAIFIIAISASTALATSGACSSHEGVDCEAGQDLDGSVICNDATRDSSVMYRDMRNECGIDFIPFNDLEKEHENYESIITLYENNVINGYPDQTFKADNKVNRAEFLKILIEGNGIELDSAQYHSCFPDVADDWYAKYVCYAKEMNWIQGYPDGDFKPENQIAFVEALKMLIEIHDYAGELPPAEDPDYWYVPYGELAVEKGFISYASPPYNPLEYQSRAQIAEMTYRSMMVKEHNVNSYLDYIGPVPVLSEMYIGELDAPVTIYEYSDFECPFCARLHAETFAQLKIDYIDTGDILYIAKDFPLSFHAHAYEAAHVARCAGDQDSYWEMRDLLYTNQGDWDYLSDSAEVFIGYVALLELDVDIFNTCMVDKIFMSKIDADFAEGQALGIQGTPTLIVNGKFFIGSQPYDELTDFIDSILYN